MAKITANGAKEVAKIRAKRGPHEYLFAINSKGTVLYRVTGEYGGGYVVFQRKTAPISHLGLEALVVRSGYTVIHQ
jgi:hypothetical protein